MAADPVFTRELLSRHETLAEYAGTEEGKESMLRVFPPRPNKVYALFKIVEYLEYEKTGEYGDPRQDAFRLAYDDSNMNAALALSSLEEGQRVLLSWNHDYVTRSESVDGRETAAHYPERVVTKLEPCADLERRPVEAALER